jgi:hypothetical protein
MDLLEQAVGDINTCAKNTTRLRLVDAGWLADGAKPVLQDIAKVNAWAYRD